MALNEGPFGTYGAIGGVVNATAKADIAAALTELKSLILTDSAETGAPGGGSRTKPDFDPVRAEYARLVHGEVDAINALIQAAAEA